MLLVNRFFILLFILCADTVLAQNISPYPFGSSAPTGPAGGILSGTYPNPSFASTTGSGATVLATSPTLITPNIGVATATTINGNIITGSGTLVLGASKILTVVNTLSLSGTDGSTLNIGTGGTLGSNAFTSTTYAPLSNPVFSGIVTIPSLTLGATSITSTGIQINYLNIASGVTGTTNLVYSTSPTLITPIIGAATASSLKPASDSTTALRIFKADGATRIIDIDTSNNRVGINKTPAAFDLDVNGAVNVGTVLTFGTLSATSLTTSTSTITSLTTNNSPDTSNDYFLYFSAADGAIRKCTVGACSAAGASGVTSLGGLTGAVGVTGNIIVSGTDIRVSATPTFTSVNGLTITSSTGTLTIANGKTLTASNSVTLAGGDASVLAIAASKTLTVSNSLTFTGTDATSFIFPAVSGTVTTIAGTQTLTNKTLNSPIIATISNTGTLTLPTSTDTLVGKATTDTFTNKTFDTAGSGNSFSINGVAVTANTGTGAVARATSPTFVTPALGTPASGTLTNTTGFPTANLAGAGAGVLTFLATPSSANLATAVTDETGSGVLVFNNSPTLIGNTITGTINGATLDNNAWTVTNPTPSCGTATFSAVSVRNKAIGKSNFFQGTFTISAIGTCTGPVTVALPFNPVSTVPLSVVNQATFVAKLGECTSGASRVDIFATGATAPGTTGEVIYFSGVCEAS